MRTPMTRGAWKTVRAAMRSWGATARFVVIICVIAIAFVGLPLFGLHIVAP